MFDTRSWLACTLVCCTCAMGQHNTNRDFHFGDRSYYLVDSPATWNDSIRICRAQNASLVVINCACVAEDVKKIMIAYNMAAIHAGFHDAFTHGDYVTLFDETLQQNYGEVSAWTPGYPLGGANSCGGFSLAGLIDVDCSDTQKFICSFNKKKLREVTTLPGYVNIPNHGNYKVMKNVTRWTDAERSCRRDGAHLVVVNSREEVAALEKHLGVDHFWVGAHRFFGGDGDWITVLGGALNATGYVTWVPGYTPSDFTTRPVLWYEHSGNYRGLTTSTTNGTLPYICEQEIQ